MMNENKLYLRNVQPEDIDILFAWANDEVVRKNGFHTEQISYDEHQEWFEKILKDKKQAQYIFMSGEDAVGQLRVSIEDDCAQLHYSIASEYRNRGFGKALIQLARQQIYYEYPDIRKLIARVKPENAASLRCFEENGFSKEFIQYELWENDFYLADNESTAQNRGGIAP